MSAFFELFDKSNLDDLLNVSKSRFGKDLYSKMIQVIIQEFFQMIDLIVVYIVFSVDS